jgi:hypothetical protein
MSVQKRTLEDLLYNELCEFYGVPEFRKKRKIACQLESCLKTPIYGYVEKYPTHCYSHRIPGMYNVIGKHCQHEETCFTSASFGHPGGKPMYCKKHKQKDMINLVIKHCAVCDKKAGYGNSKFLPTHCLAHKADDMVPKKEVEEHEKVAPIKSNHCANCMVKAYFGNCDTGRKFCKNHMNPETDWRITFCQHEKCREVATFLKQDTLNMFCLKHAQLYNHVIQFAPPHRDCSPVPNLLQADTSLPDLFPELPF